MTMPHERQPLGGLPEVVPLFPLPDHVLLPGVPTPYRLFEPRYRALARDLLKRPPADRWIAIPRLAPGWQEDYEGSPAFVPVATIARVLHLAPLPDGEFHIVVQGVARVQLEEIESDRAYRMASAVAVEDRPPSPEESDAFPALLEGLCESVRVLARTLGPPAHELANLLRERDDVDLLVFRLASVMVQEPDRRQHVLESVSLNARVDVVLEQIATLTHLASRRGGSPGSVPEG